MPIGVWALSYVSVDILSGLVAFMLILYGGYLRLVNLPLITGNIQLDSMIGAIGGFLGDLRLSGAIPLWFAMRDMTKQDTRAIFVTIYYCFHAIVLAFRGAYQKTQFIISHRHTCCDTISSYWVKVIQAAFHKPIPAPANRNHIIVRFGNGLSYLCLLSVCIDNRASCFAHLPARDLSSRDMPALQACL